MKNYFMLLTLILSSNAFSEVTEKDFFTGIDYKLCQDFLNEQTSPVFIQLSPAEGSKSTTLSSYAKTNNKKAESLESWQTLEQDFTDKANRIVKFETRKLKSNARTITQYEVNRSLTVDPVTKRKEIFISLISLGASDKAYSVKNFSFTIRGKKCVPERAQHGLLERNLYGNNDVHMREMFAGTNEKTVYSQYNQNNNSFYNLAKSSKKHESHPVHLKTCFESKGLLLKEKDISDANMEKLYAFFKTNDEHHWTNKEVIRIENEVNSSKKNLNERKKKKFRLLIKLLEKYQSYCAKIMNVEKHISSDLYDEDASTYDPPAAKPAPVKKKSSDQSLI